ncbi:MAG: hypothetical protein COS88_04635 [Chloroflexi bacterium CG07_land_8_20_14_0_80_51_10]|nr:MAG: hypothetical protein COS88_04635 [Chloroflexi bacterium CG07_land_8_20_14_0_80_51_10]
MIRFSYEKRESESLGTVMRPMADILVKKRNEDKWYRISMIIDSGADVTLLPSMYASLLGIELGNCKSYDMRGVGGTTNIYLSNLDVELDNLRMNMKVGFIAGNIPPLMGRADFFRAFEICFKRDEILFVESDKNEG